MIRFFTVIAIGFSLIATTTLKPLESFAGKRDFRNLGIGVGIGIGLGILKNKFDRKKRKKIRRTRKKQKSSRPQNAIGTLAIVGGVYALQQKLTELGYNPGGVDGKWGGKTASALKSWQRDKGFAPNGVFNENQYATMHDSGQATSEFSDTTIISTSSTVGALVNKFSSNGKFLNVPNKAGTILAEWEGVALCKKNEDFLVSLTFWQKDNGRIQGRIAYMSANKLATSWTNFIMLGESTGQNEYEFVVESLYENAGVQLGYPNVRVEYDPQTETMTGKFTSGNCTSLTASKVTSSTPSRLVLVSQNLGDGQFWKTNAPFERCKVFKTWLGKFTNDLGEYNRDLRYKAHLLLADEQFIPAFGVSVDTLNPKRADIIYKSYRSCFNDPIWKNRLQAYKNYGYELVNFAFSSTRYNSRNKFLSQTDMLAWRLRKNRNEFKSDMVKLDPITDGDEILRLVEAIKLKKNQNSKFFLPSETSNLEKIFSKEKTRAYSLKADAEINALNKIQDPLSSLRKSNELFGRMTVFSGYLSKEKLASFRQEIASVQAEASEKIVTPILAGGDLTNPTLNGLEKFESNVSASATAFELMASDVREQMNIKIELHRNVLLSALVDRRSVELSNVELNSEGAQQSVEWIGKFEGDFKSYLETPQVKNVIDSYSGQREILLAGALDAFKSELGVAANENPKNGIDQLLGKYLSWSGDRNLPVSREYYLIAAQHEVDRLSGISSAMNGIIESKRVFQSLDRFADKLPKPELATLKQTSKNIHIKSADKLLGRFFNVSEIDDIAGLQNFERRTAKAEPVFKRMLPEIAEKYRRKAQKTIEATLKRIVQGEAERLNTFPPNAKGLRSSAAWLSEVSKRLGVFSKSVDMSGLQDKFITHRQQLLGSALDNFEKDVENAANNGGSEAVKKVLQSYLSWKGDEELPVALEYQFIAETYL